MRSDEMRGAFKELGLTYKDVTKRDIRVLMTLIELEIGSYNETQRDAEICITMSLRWDPEEAYDEDGGLRYAFIRCDGSYFDDREAISFNPDGFICFCGWADYTRTAVFINAFDRWLCYLSDGETYIERKF